MGDLGFSTKSIQSILQKENWVEIYRQELTDRLSALEEIKDAFPKRRFVRVIKPQLDFLEKSNVNVREPIRRWMLISHSKFYSLLKILSQLPKELSEAEEIGKKYSGVPIGPLDPEIFKQMSKTEIQRWHEGNIILNYTTTSIQNFLGIFVSELFFTIEAMCRAICTGSCLYFAVKSVSPEITIQHNEIFKTLRRLDNEKNNVSCKLCSLKNKCSIYGYSKIADVYELFYHIRAVKDYRLEFYFTKKLLKFLFGEYVRKGFQATYIIDTIMNRLFLGYLESPLSLEEETEKIMNILSSLGKISTDAFEPTT